LNDGIPAQIGSAAQPVDRTAWSQGAQTAFPLP
jgi:hypothetical protein